MILKNRATLAALALLAASAMVAGCIRDAQWLDPDDGKSEGDLVLVLNMPGGFRPPGQSRAPISSGDEEKIDDLWVLMFDNSPNKLLIDIARASQTSDTPITFSVPLPSTLTVGSQVNLVLLANSEDILNAPGGIGTTLNNIPSVNRYYNNLMPLITAGVDGKLVTGAGASLRIPMWGESTTVTIQAEGNVVPQTISMLRALARVDVGVGQLSGNEGNFTWDGLDGAGRSIPFDITSVYVVRPNNFYRLVPDAAKTQSGLPSVPTVATPLEVSDAASFCYTVTGGGITREIYIPEADIKSGGIDRHRDRMALVVGGIFDNSGIETFYRVDFGDGEDLDDVLRNHIYTFSIHGVLVAGEPTVEAAYGSQSINMQVDIHDWDEGFNWNIWFENSKYIAMNRQQLTFSPLPGETVDVRVLTNIVDGDSPDEGIFSFSLFDDPNETIVLSTARPGPYTGPAGYIYTIIPVAVGEYTLRVQNPIANIGDSDASRVENWVIHSLGLAINFHVGQSYSRGGVFRVNGADLTTGQGAFLTPEGNTGNPIHFEIITMEAGTIEVYNADGSPATWIDLGNTGALQTPTNGYYHYTNDLVVAPYRYNNGSTVDRTAIITITSGARTIHYNVSQQAPYIRTERKTVAVNNPNMTTSTIVPVYITTNIDPANLLVSQTGGLGSPISLSSGSSLVSYDPRNPANQRFDVRVQFQAGDDNTYRATFNVADTSGMYGSLPAVSIDVVVPPATWTFGAFWQEGTFAGDPNAPAWAPSTQEWSHGAPTYIFPWNTTEVSFELDSNVGVEFDAATMTSDDMSHLTPAPGVGGVYTFDTRKNSYNTISRHHLAFTSDPEITTDDPLLLQRTAVDFSLGIQIFQVSNNAYTGNNIDWQGVDAADQAEFKLVSCGRPM